MENTVKMVIYIVLKIAWISLLIQWCRFLFFSLDRVPLNLSCARVANEAQFMTSLRVVLRIRYCALGGSCWQSHWTKFTSKSHANIIELFIELFIRYVGINPLIPTLTACSAPLGMDNQLRLIKDAQISASSEWDGNHAAIQGRLNFLAHPGKQGGWSAKNKNLNQWIQVDLLTKTTITQMATQGRNAHNQWVKKYRMQYSDDGVNFNFYQTPGQNFPKVHCTLYTGTCMFSFTSCTFPLG